ncbi:PstS family phosphate ABC transporter substrate-binding protein [Parapedobacter pyrenivorans]|nr:substrate-binding domain-containing protein [Parapedobacter pyrenivorans]
MKKLVLLPLIFGLLAFLWSCNNRQPKENQTIVSGQLQVLVDETLSPIMEEQVAVFEHLYKRTDVALSVGQENQIVSKLVNTDVEVVVLTRQLNEDEMKFFEARQFRPRVHKFATDAIALIVNKNSPDSVVHVDDIIRVMRGKQPAGHVNRLVFDNPNSSTVRFLKELAGVDSLPDKGVYAMKSNADVLKYVYETPQTMGVLGISWIVRPDSTLQMYADGVKVLGVRNQAGKPGSDGFYKPSQSNLAEGHYPLSRSVYIVNAEPRKSLGMGFAAFLTGVTGQRIILKSGLMPDSLPPRELIIRSK